MIWCCLTEKVLRSVCGCSRIYRATYTEMLNSSSCWIANFRCLTVNTEFCQGPTELQYSVYRQNRVMSGLVIRDTIQIMTMTNAVDSAPESVCLSLPLSTQGSAACPQLDDTGLSARAMQVSPRLRFIPIVLLLLFTKTRISNTQAAHRSSF